MFILRISPKAIIIFVKTALTSAPIEKTNINRHNGRYS